LQWSALRSSDEKAGETLGVMQGQLIAIQNATKDTHSGLVDVQRAFITSSELEIDPIRSEDNSVAAWNIKVILENSGSTPARDLRFWGDGITSWSIVATPSTFQIARNIRLKGQVFPIPISNIMQTLPTCNDSHWDRALKRK